MEQRITFPAHLLPAGYREHFSIEEFKFRWHEASGLDCNLHFRANHLASRLMSLRVTDAQLVTNKQTLARITNMSVRTMDRALGELEDRGWVQVTRDAGLQILLVLPDHGLEALLVERQSLSIQREQRHQRETAVQSILQQIASAHSVRIEELQFDKQWAIFRQRVRSVVNRMSSLESEIKTFMRTLSDPLPADVVSLPALLSSRIDIHLRHYSHLSHRQPKSARRVSKLQGETNLDQILQDLTASLSYPKAVGGDC
jgi:DNA-binding GntR family transcriptional regulator